MNYLYTYLIGSVISLLWFNYAVNVYLSHIEYDEDLEFKHHVWIVFLALVWPVSVPVILGKAWYEIWKDGRDYDE